MARSPANADTKSFTIVLPTRAAERLEVLVKTGLYGTSRANVASHLILKELQRLWETGKLPD